MVLLSTTRATYAPWFTASVFTNTVNFANELADTDFVEDTYAYEVLDLLLIINTLGAHNSLPSEGMFAVPMESASQYSQFTIPLLTFPVAIFIPVPPRIVFPP